MHRGFRRHQRRIRSALVGRAIAMLVCGLGYAVGLASCGSSAGNAAEQQQARYESDLSSAISALAGGGWLAAERFAFALTLLDESRCEGHAALGASLAMQQKREAAVPCFDRAKAQSGGSIPLLLDLIAHASGLDATPVARSDGQGIAKWESTLAEALAALLAGDPGKAERLAYASTRLEEGRCEIEALRGTALMRLSQSGEAEAAFEIARRQAVGPEASLLRILEAVLRAPAQTAVLASSAPSAPRSTASPLRSPETPFFPAPVAPQTWCDVLVAAPDPEVVTDAEGRARIVSTGRPWKVQDKKSGIVMLLCPPGEFWMGSPAGEVGRHENEALQRVSMKQPFYLSETEVTQAEWANLMGASPSHFKGPSRPVEQVSHDDCQRFCGAAGLRLPSEAEWEYACRAGTSTRYAGDLDSMGWYLDNSGGATHAVKERLPNAWGFYDMHGNVREWCADAYVSQAVGTQLAAIGDSPRIVRGGAWFFSAAECRSAFRDFSGRGSLYYFYGFRVARTAE